MFQSPQTAEEVVVAALRAGTLDVHTEVWRQRLAATGLESADVRLVARAVDSSREALKSTRSCAFATVFSVSLCVGIGLLLLGGLLSRTSEGRSMGIACGALFVAMAVGAFLWVVVRRRWGLALLAGVEPILVTAMFPAKTGSVQGIQKSRIVYLKDRF